MLSSQDSRRLTYIALPSNHDVANSYDCSCDGVLGATVTVLHVLGIIVNVGLDSHSAVAISREGCKRANPVGGASKIKLRDGDSNGGLSGQRNVGTTPPQGVPRRDNPRGPLTDYMAITACVFWNEHLYNAASFYTNPRIDLPGAVSCR